MEGEEGRTCEGSLDEDQEEPDTRVVVSPHLDDDDLLQQFLERRFGDQSLSSTPSIFTPSSLSSYFSLLTDTCS